MNARIRHIFPLLALAAGCVQDVSGAAEDTGSSELGEGRRRALPDLSGAPSIQAAVQALEAGGTTLRVDAIVTTKQLAFQVYECNGTAWGLRTPLATLEPARPRRGSLAFSSLIEANHYRSDFGGLLTDVQKEALGLRSGDTFVNRPIWDFTFAGAGDDRRDRREIVSAVVGPGQPVADANGAGNIPQLFLTVLGNYTDRDDLSPIATSTHMLRWNTSGGVAPATTCDATLMNKVVEVPYFTEYYFLSAT